MTRPADVVVVGAGVIGLTLAYELAGQGAAVCVLDSGPLGREASWAGAGMLAPPARLPLAEPLDALRDQSVKRHATLSQELRDRTGIDTGYLRCGGIEVAASGEGGLDDYLGLLRERGVECELLGSTALHELEPALADHVERGVYLPGKAQIRNPRHLQALVQACRLLGVELEPDLACRKVRVEQDAVRGVETSRGLVPAGQVVVAAGAWSEQLLAGVGLNVPTEPVRGQIVLLNTRGATQGPRTILEQGDFYLVPRGDGRVLAGSTEEHVGFLRGVTDPEIARLIHRAVQMCPALATADTEKTWSGLRPGSRDAYPTIGPVPGIAGLFVATGHFRAGLQLSTGTATRLSAVMLGQAPADCLRPFAVDRQAVTAPPLFRS